MSILWKLLSNTLYDDCGDVLDTLLSGICKVMTLKGFYYIPLSSWFSSSSKLT